MEEQFEAVLQTVEAAVRKAIAKQAGDTVVVRLEERRGG
jgi:hypothetical protein